MADITLKKIAEVLDKKLKPINKKLDEHSIKLDSLTLDMIRVQKKTDILPDLHSYIKEKVDDHEERIQRLENVV